MNLYYIGQLVVTGLVMTHAWSVPESRWAAADRDRAWWLGLLGACGLLAVGLVAVAGYLLFVVPQLRDEVHTSFSKGGGRS